MNYWFIRLGSQEYKEDMNLYQALARKHSLIMIGYGIKEDITDRSRDEIRKYFHDTFEYRSHKLGRIASLVNSFINGIEIGDTIISPFDNNSYLQIGKVVKTCKIVETSLNKNQLEEILTEYPGEENNDPLNKPAIKVEWLPGKVRMDEIPRELQKSFKSLRATVNNLKLDGTDDKAHLKFSIKKLAEKKEAEVQIDTEKRNNFLKTAWTAVGATFLSTILTSVIDKIFANCTTAWLCTSWIIIFFAIITIVTSVIFIISYKDLVWSFIKKRDRWDFVGFAELVALFILLFIYPEFRGDIIKLLDWLF